MKGAARAVALVGLAIAGTTASAQYAVPTWTVDSGGGRSQGGPYVVVGTIGQADADALQPIRGGRFAITGGHWRSGSGVPNGNPIFRDGFE